MSERRERTYYELSLSAGQLTAALGAVAALVVAAFVLGYAAAWTVRTAEPPSPAPVATPPSAATPAPAPSPTPTPRPAAAATTPAPVPTPTPTSPPAPTATPRPVRASRAAPAPAYWVQVLASHDPEAIRGHRQRLARLGFPESHQRVLKVRTADGNLLLKLRVGPFPDAASARRVRQRMRAAGYRDAWVVRP